MQSDLRSVVGILGLGVDGSCVARFLREQKEVQGVIIFDDKIEGENIFASKFERGSNLSGINLLFRSPGFPLTHPLLKEAKEQNIPVTSSTIEVLKHFRGVTIGITGSNGKTTCSALIEECLKAEFGEDHVHRGGNDGVPRLDLIDTSLGMRGYVIPSSPEAAVEGRIEGHTPATRDDRFLVLELSSFQLIDCPVSPNIAVVLNISPNHLDWHKDMHEYREAKRQIVAHQKGGRGNEEGDIAILNQDDSIVKTFAEGVKSEVRWFGESDSLSHIPLPFSLVRCKTHPATICAAVTAARALHVSEENIIKVLQEFPGVPHRLEFIRELNGKNWYNDSSCTTPESAITACNAFPKGSLTILMGGRNKGMDYSKLYEVIKERDVAVVSYGEMAETFQKNIPISSKLQAPSSFVEAIKTAHLTGRQNIVLSPACASFDMFENAKERGKKFTELVQSF